MKIVFRDRQWHEELISGIYERFVDAYYYVYHLIKASHRLQTGLKPGRWYEVSTLMEETILFLVDDYVSRKGQDAFNHGGMTSPWEQEARYALIRALHLRYIEIPDINKKISALYKEIPSKIPIIKEDGLFRFRPSPEEEENCQRVYDEIRLLEEKLNGDMTRVLIDLIDVRRLLWT